jgi:PAS domain S-box-containing protein
MGARSKVLHEFGDDFAWSLFDAAPDGILLVATSGEIAFANDHAGTLFGCTAEDLLGTVVDDLLPQELRGRHRAHRTRYSASPTVRQMGGGLELRALRSDGSGFFAEISLSPLPLGDDQFVVAAVRDISDRVASEDHLHRVLATLDASDDGIFIFDADTLRYSHVNDGAVRLVGYDRTELTEMGPAHLNPYSSEADYRELVERLLDGDLEMYRRETSLLRKDGTEVPVEKTYRAGPTARDGTRWVVAMARDISARRAAEAELQASQDALRSAERAVLLADDRDRIAQDLHDTVIQRMFAAGLSLQALAATTDDRVRARLETTVDDLDSTIGDLRSAIFSLQARRHTPGLRGRLLDVVTEVGAAMSSEPRLQLDGPIDDLSETVADELLPTLREALSNVAHHADARNVRVCLTVDDDVLLEVVDDGCGIKGEVLGGNGLANMARRAEKLGGSLSVDPAPGGGTHLRWSVPARR